MKKNLIIKLTVIMMCLLPLSLSAGETDTLDARQRAIVPIAAFTANGNLPQLRAALAEGLDAGLTINEINEVLVQMYAYCGFPKSLNALNAFLAVTEERKAVGKKDVRGADPTPVPDDVDMSARGEETRTRLVGRPVTGKVYEFAPVADEYLRSHLFGDIFSRDNLDHHSRELATIAALAAMGMDAQLRSHLSICRNLGFTEGQLREFASIMALRIGYTEGETATRVLNKLLNKDTNMNSSNNNEEVTLQRVTFPNRNITVVGHLYLPAGFNPAQKYSAVIVGHPAGGVKEQTAGTYARRLAGQGFVTLAFDASYQGESGGEPRGLEDPAVRTEDYRCAANYLTTLSYVGNIGAMGICGGGGFAIAAAITDHRIKAVAGVSAVDLGQLRRDGLGGSLKATIQQRLEAVAAQRIVEAKGGEIKYSAYVPNSLDEIPEGAPVMYREGYEYYRTPLGQHPRSTNKYTFTSLDKLISFTAFDHLELLAPRPLLMIAGSRADTFYYSQDAYDRANEPKELYVVDGASHIQLYWKPEYVEQVSRKLTEYFNKYLNK